MTMKRERIIAKWMADNNIASIQEVFNDPSNDNFVFFNDQKFVNEPNILKRF